MQNKIAQAILAKMPQGQRKAISDIISGQIVAQVFCNSEDAYKGTGKKKKLTREGCKGRLIGNIYKDGAFRAVSDEDGKMYCRASRHRLDGNWGFECWCGNDSRLSKHEKGVPGLENNSVQKEDIELVFKKLETDPANYPLIDGAQEVDGFTIKLIGDVK